MKSSSFCLTLATFAAVGYSTAPASAAFEMYLSVKGDKQSQIKGESRHVHSLGRFSMDGGSSWVAVTAFLHGSPGVAGTASVTLDTSAGMPARVKLPDDGDAIASIVIVAGAVRYTLSTTHVSHVERNVAAASDSFDIAYAKVDESPVDAAAQPLLHFAEAYPR